jgi:hypothetical protein
MRNCLSTGFELPTQFCPQLKVDGKEVQHICQKQAKKWCGLTEMEIQELV